MPTIALRVPTVVTSQPNLPGGHCYMIFAQSRISVRDLISEKVRAELRKARAGGPATSTAHLLTGHEVGHGPLDEQLAIAQATRAFEAGDWLLLNDGHPLTDLNEEIVLTRRTGLMFLVPEPEQVTA